MIGTSLAVPRRRRPLFILIAVAATGLGALITFSGCQVATPFRGDGFDRARGVTLPDVGPVVVVAVTNALIDPARRADFDRFTTQSADSLSGAGGYIGHSLRLRILGSEAWTMTVWRDEAALEAWVRNPVHRKAMREGTSTLRSARFLRFTWPTADVPPRWSEVLKRLNSVEFDDYPA